MQLIYPDIFILHKSWSLAVLSPCNYCELIPSLGDTYWLFYSTGFPLSFTFSGFFNSAEIYIGFAKS